MPKRRSSQAQIAGAITREVMREIENGDTDNQVIAEEPDAGELDALEALAALGEGGDYIYKLHCLAPLDKKGHLEDLTRAEIPTLETYIRDIYGAGRFSVHMVGPDRKYVKGSYRVITISPLAARRAAESAQSSGGSGGSGEFERWRAEQEARRRDDEARAERFRQERREDMKFYAPLALQLLAGMTGQRESLSTMIGAMGGLKGLAGDGGSQTEMLLKGIELASKLNGKEPDSVLGIVREAIHELAPVARGLVGGAGAGGARQALPPPTRQAPAVPVTLTPGAAAPAPAPGGASGAPSSGAASAPSTDPAAPAANAEPTVMDKIAQELLEFAIADADPRLAADAIYGKLPMMVPQAMRVLLTDEKIRELVSSEEWWPTLTRARPALEPYRPYVDRVREAFLELLSPPAETP